MAVDQLFPARLQDPIVPWRGKWRGRAESSRYSVVVVLKENGLFPLSSSSFIDIVFPFLLL